MKEKTVFVSGASAGIGYACAEVFAEAGARLILLARRKEKLDILATGLLDKFGTESIVLAGDVRDPAIVQELYQNLPTGWKDIDVLINNAGLARGMEKIQEGLVQNWEEMIDTNIKGLLYLSRLVLPGMAERKRGTVVNIASIAGREVYPGGNVYCATKSAVKALSRAMMIDMNGTGVRICNIDPGLVETEFANVRFHGDVEKARKVYEGYKPLTGRDVAEAALFAATRPDHVCLQDILITPSDQATATIVNKKE